MQWQLNRTPHRAQAVCAGKDDVRVWGRIEKCAATDGGAELKCGGAMEWYNMIFYCATPPYRRCAAATVSRAS